MLFFSLSHCLVYFVKAAFCTNKGKCCFESVIFLFSVIDGIHFRMGGNDALRLRFYQYANVLVSFALNNNALFVFFFVSFVAPLKVTIGMTQLFGHPCFTTRVILFLVLF